MKHKSLIFCVVLGLFLFPGTSSPQENETGKTLQDAIRKGLDYLLKNQGSDGSWGSSKNVKAEKSKTWATSALAILAIHMSQSKVKLEKSHLDSMQKAIKFLLEFQPKEGKPKSYDNRHWNTAYTLFCLAKLYRDGKDEKIKEKLDGCVKALVSGQEAKGGWTYLPKGERAKDEKEEEKQDQEEKTKVVKDVAQQTFLTAAVLISLVEAKNAGVDISDKVITKAVDFLQSMRTEDAAFRYRDGLGQKSDKTVSSPLGSSGRSVACELALFLAGGGSQEKLIAALDNFFKYQDKLEARRKQGATAKGGKPSEKGNTLTHDMKNGGIAPYYFFYSHFYASQALHFVGKDSRIQIGVPDPVDKTPQEAIETLKEMISALQEDEFGGSWLDSGHGGRTYGTSMAILILCGNKILADPIKQSKGK